MPPFDASAGPSLADDVRRITEAVEEITGLTSRWNGIISVETFANYSGAKHFDCSISIRQDIEAHSILRWRTLLHEAIHGLSRLYSREQYDRLKGWEEGVVEQTQRLLRQRVFDRIGVAVPEEALRQYERNHPFNQYITVLEELREHLGRPAEAFYLLLLGTSLPDRPALMKVLGKEIEDVALRVRYARSLLFAHAKLTKEVRYESGGSD